MEEDIKILEEYLDFIKDYDIGSEHILAIENLIKGYKEKEEENKELKNKIKKVKKICKEKSSFQTFGDEGLKRALEMYVNRTKNDILYLL